MKKLVVLLLTVIGGTLYLGSNSTAGSQNSRAYRQFTELVAQKIKADAFGVSPRVSDLPPAEPDPKDKSSKLGKADAAERTIPNKLPFRERVSEEPFESDAAIARVSNSPMPAPELSFEGLSSNDNAAAYGFRVLPPDTNGDVGRDHYVQTVNLLFRVYDKNGTALTPPLKISSLFAPLGTPCSTRNDGDPVVLYDNLADRWYISQYCNNAPPFRQMIAVSKTGDPTGSWFIYEFAMPNVKQNDYPKFGIWHDALYMSTDEFFGSDYAGSGAFAFDRDKLIAGDPGASYIYFDLASPTTIRIGGLLPVDLDGTNAPPRSAPAMFIGYTANEYGDPQDALRVFEFRPDFGNPSNSTFGESAESPLVSSPFDPTSNTGRDDIEQPAPGERLDSQSDRLMYRAAYRNLGFSESVVVNQTVRVSAPGQPYRAGVRVYELRRNTGQFVINEQATIGAIDTNRFMGAAAQDHKGNIAVGYSRSNIEKQPAISYTGKLAAEPAGTYRNEADLIAGTGVQTAFGFRWGDYSGLSSDPSDGCSFWITNQYYTLQSQNESPFGWLTRIGKFRFTECTDEALGKIEVFVVNDENNELIENGLVKTYLNGDLNSVPFVRFSKPNGAIDPVWTPAGTHRVVVSAAGFLTKSFDVTVTAIPDQSSLLNARLTPTAVIANSSVAITSESCAANGSIEPSESVTIDLALRNTGFRATNNLVVTLLSGSGVQSPGPPRVYGVLSTSGEIVIRDFSFTASASLQCGNVFDMRFQLNDGAQDLGILTIPVQTGLPNIVFQENFDGVIPPSLPSGWSTSFKGVTSNWTTTTARSESGPNAAFSPAPRTIGVNELVSPEFSVATSGAVLRFRNWYELETTFLRNRVYDGAVLEIRIGNGDWQDILTAGGFFLSGGYNDGVLDACCSNPLAGRRAWSGRSGIDPVPMFIDSVAKLPASAAGNNVRLRWRVATDNGTFKEGQYIDNIVITDGFRCDCKAPRTKGAPFDFDGDGKSDRGLFRASDSPAVPDFRVQQSSSGSETGTLWGSTGDVPVNADYDGDRKTDYAVFRPSTRTWFILQSSDGLFRVFDYGLTDDIPAPADFDGDGKHDAAVYRRSTGTWYILRSSDGVSSAWRFGIAEDIPVPADYDGDSISDVAVYRPSTGIWYVLKSSDSGVIVVRFGLDGDKPAPGDFDGDNKADFVLYRPTEKNWYLLNTSVGFSAVRFGLEEDLPLQADFDGDGKRDIALYRPSTGVWYFISSFDGSIGINQFGSDQDAPIPGIYVRH